MTQVFKCVSLSLSCTGNPEAGNAACFPPLTHTTPCPTLCHLKAVHQTSTPSDTTGQANCTDTTPQTQTAQKGPQLHPKASAKQCRIIVATPHTPYLTHHKGTPSDPSLTSHTIGATTTVQEMLDLGSAGVDSITCGTHSSGVTTGDGHAWMWGWLMDASYALNLERQHAPAQGRSAQDVSVALTERRLAWPGFGANVPTLVPGLEKVARLALGGWHAVSLHR